MTDVPVEGLVSARARGQREGLDDRTWPVNASARDAPFRVETFDAVVHTDVPSIWALGSTGKFVWPIPDKGLKKRIHRITAPTLIIWGRHDKLISSVYAQEFADRIVGARVEIIEEAGHVPQWEALEKIGPLVTGFLDAG